MRARILWAIAVVLSLFAASCKQDPIFYIISTETAPRKPRIEGAPTNMVLFRRTYPGMTVTIMYVASGRLHWYAKAPGDEYPGWDSGEYPMPQPGGKIISLAVANDRMYALCREGNGVKAELRYIESGGDEWKTIYSDTADIQSMYVAAGSNRLFAGAGINTYRLLYLDNDDTLQLLRDDTSLLSGAIFKENSYYLATRGGIFQISETALAANNIGAIRHLTDNSDVGNTNDDRMFMSIITLGSGDIIAVERDGGLYQVSGSSFTRMKYTSGSPIVTGNYATEAVALWQETPEGGRRLFIVGTQGSLYTTTSSSYTHGYVEFDLRDNGSFDNSFERRDPSISVRGDTDRYTASLGKHPVNHMFQAPREIDPDMTFFASTQTAGLWSYRFRPDNGGWQWNAEE